MSRATTARNIARHAEQRTNLQLHLMTSLYALNRRHNGHVTVTRIPATLQYGKGSRLDGTHACHPALFPNVAITVQKYSGRTIDLTSDYQQTTHYHKQNRTNVLPSTVNGVDAHIERQTQPTNVMQTCTMVLNAVANGLLNPYIGMHLFYRTMNDFFSSNHHRYINRVQHSNLPETKKRILAYQRVGTFKHATPELTITGRYLRQTLKLQDISEKEINDNPDALKQHYREIRDKVWEDRHTP